MEAVEFKSSEQLDLTKNDFETKIQCLQSRVIKTQKLCKEAELRKEALQSQLNDQISASDEFRQASKLEVIYFMRFYFLIKC